MCAAAKEHSESSLRMTPCSCNTGRRKSIERNGKTEFQRSHDWKIFRRPEILRQFHGACRGHAFTRGRFSQGPEEIPAREILGLLAGRVSPCLLLILYPL